MLESVLTGIGLGIVLSFVTGPVFFALIKTSIERGFLPGFFLACGVVTCDVIYAALSVYGSSLVVLEQKYRLPLGLTGAVVLTAIGLYYLIKKVSIDCDHTITKRHYYGYFFKGFLMCIFNPGILIYWATLTSGIVSVSGKLSPAAVVPMYVAILVTQLSTDAIKGYYASKFRYKIKERTLVRLNRIAGGLMLLFAASLVYELVLR